ncbi:hypothetical protein [Leucobacter sp. W1038]|uniref:hypothetical protein n=1 Tax=Leucobacter sp. W1038 TaxID=3438281 RepID=UPI003D950D45
MALILEEEWDALLWKLYRATKANLLPWAKDEARGGTDFIVSTASGISYKLASVDQDGNFPYRLEIYAADGALIDLFVSQAYRENDESPSEALAELYPMVGRQVSGAANTVAVILSDLDSLLKEEKKPF